MRRDFWKWPVRWRCNEALASVRNMKNLFLQVLFCVVDLPSWDYVSKWDFQLRWIYAILLDYAQSESAWLHLSPWMKSWTTLIYLCIFIHMALLDSSYEYTISLTARSLPPLSTIWKLSSRKEEAWAIMIHLGAIKKPRNVKTGNVMLGLYCVYTTHT